LKRLGQNVVSNGKDAVLFTLVPESAITDDTWYRSFTDGQPYVYFVTVKDGAYLGPLLSSAFAYRVDLVFDHPLDGSKGLAQFEWRQSLKVLGRDFSFRGDSEVQFANRIDDVRTLAGFNVDGNPIYTKLPVPNYSRWTRAGYGDGSSV